MADLVSPQQIETIVGAKREDARHLGRAVSSSETIYVLHSRQCRDRFEDLRDCPFSVALDAGTDLTQWRHVIDRAVVLEIADGGLVPTRREAWVVQDNKFGRPIGPRAGYDTKREARRAFPSYSRYTVSPEHLPVEPAELIPDELRGEAGSADAALLLILLVGLGLVMLGSGVLAMIDGLVSGG